VISLQSTLRHQAVSGNQRLPVVYDSLNTNCKKDGKSEDELPRTGRSDGRKRYVAELACPAAQIGEKLSAENEVNLDKQQQLHASSVLLRNPNRRGSEAPERRIVERLRRRLSLTLALASQLGAS
jgi:hypothetical protein